MQTITVEHTVSAGHRLHTYDGICANLHGHNIKFEVEIYAHAFLDFKVVRGELRGWLHSFDHAMVLHEVDPLLPILSAVRPHLKIFVTREEPTTEHLAYLCHDYFSKQYEVKRVTVYETNHYSATWGA